MIVTQIKAGINSVILHVQLIMSLINMYANWTVHVLLIKMKTKFSLKDKKKTITIKKSSCSKGISSYALRENVLLRFVTLF